MNPIMAAINANPLPMLNLSSRGVFVENMLFLHAIMVASEPLVEDVLKRDMERPLRSFYEEHLEEERDHAKWLADDLLALGTKPREVDWRAAQIAGMQYYLVRHAAPQALLGYMAALECRPVPLGVVDNLEKAHGSKALRTMRYHAEHDIEHGKELLRVIAASGSLDLVAQNAGLTSAMLRSTLEGMM